MRVLVVEDDTRMSRLLKRGLEEEGHAVDLDYKHSHSPEVTHPLM